MPNFDFAFFANQHLSIRVRNKTIDEALKLAHGISVKIKPLVKMVFDNGDVLYFDDYKIESFIKKEITFEQLVNYLKCKDVVFNKLPVLDENQNVIDAGSLWKLNNDNLCVLIDDDQYVESEYIEDLFESVEFKIK